MAPHELAPSLAPSASSPDGGDIAGLLLHLAGLTGVPLEAAQARRAALGESGDRALADDPLAAATAAAARCGLEINPVRCPMADALWLARSEQPLLAWQPEARAWLVIHRQGGFQTLVSTPGLPGQPEWLSRAQLARQLGLSEPSATGDFGLVHPRALVGGAKRRDGAPGSGPLPGSRAHGHDDHSHLPPVRRFLGLLRTERRDLWVIAIFSVITGLLYLALPLAINSLVSNLAFGSQSQPFLQALVVLVLALFACLTLSALLRGLQYYVAEVIQRRIFVRLAADLSFRLPRVEASAWDGVHAPELINRFLDVATVQKSTALLLLDGINSVLGALVGMTVLGFYHPFLLAFALCLLAALGFIVLVLGRGAIATSVAESVCKYEIVNWLEEIVRHTRLFKGAGGYRLAAGRADDLTRRYLATRRGHFRVLMRQIVGLLTLEVVASAALLIVGGSLVLQQQLTLGQLVAAELIVSAVVSSIAKLGKQFEAWYDALAAVDKLGYLIDLPTEHEEGATPPPATQGAEILLHDLSFGYHPGTTVLRGVQARFAPGEHVALQGEEGSGSSTLLDLLAGLHKPTEGYIAVDGLDLRTWSLPAWRKQVLLLRPTDLVQGTVADNVSLGREEIGVGHIQQALEEMGLLAEVLALPQGLATPLTTGGRPLSGRRRVRLLLARAVAMQPRLLLLDGLFEGIDPADAAGFLDPIFGPHRRWTVLVATRRPEVAERCGHRLVLPSPAPVQAPASLPA